MDRLRAQGERIRPGRSSSLSVFAPVAATETYWFPLWLKSSPKPAVHFPREVFLATLEIAKSQHVHRWLPADAVYPAETRVLLRRCRKRPPTAMPGIVLESAGSDRTWLPWPTLAATGDDPTRASRRGSPRSRPVWPQAIIPAAAHSCCTPLNTRYKLATCPLQDPSAEYEQHAHSDQAGRTP